MTFKNIVIFLLLLISTILIWRAVISPSKYIGFYYPSASDLTQYKQSPELDSLEECRIWIEDVSEGRTDTGFDYECGKNCKLTESGGIYVCDETLE